MVGDPMELISSVRAGDVFAFEELSIAYRPLLESQVAHALKVFDAEIPTGYREDLYQEALLALYKATCSYIEGGISFGAYAKVCVRNSLYTAASRITRQYPMDRDTVDLQLVFDDIEDPDASPEEMVMAEERASEIHSFIEKELTEYERRVFSLHLSHRTYAEIATETGRDVKSVANAIVRVREKFRKRGF